MVLLNAIHKFQFSRSVFTVHKTNMTSTWLFGILILFQINGLLGERYQILATKAKCESLTDKIQLNISITDTGGLSLYINIKKDLHALYTTVNLAVDLNNHDEYDFDVVKRTVDCCKLFKDPTYEPVVQFIYKIFLDSGHFPTNCPVKKDLYFFDNLKVDPEKLPQLMTEKRAFLTIKHLVKEKNKFKMLAYYQVYFRMEKIDLKEIDNVTDAIN